jgi:hypothetical protein
LDFLFPQKETTITAPCDQGLAMTRLAWPLKVVMWPRIFGGGFYRERKIVEEGLRQHPALAFIPDATPDAMTAVFETVVFGRGLPSAAALDANVTLTQKLLAQRRSFHRQGSLLAALRADVIFWVVDLPPEPLPLELANYAALFDPRGLVPPSRLVVVDFRDGATKQCSPGTAAVDPPAPCAPHPTLVGGGDAVAEWVRSQRCALYLERLWLPRADGVFQPIAQVLVGADGLAGPAFGPASTGRSRLALHRPLDFAVVDEMLPRSPIHGAGGGHGGAAMRTAALPAVPLGHGQGDGGDVAAAEEAAWVAERPLRLVCLLRPSSNMPCRQRVARWVAELCLELGLADACFVGTWDDTMRGSFDENYLGLLRRAQVVVTQKPCAWEGDYRTWEAMASGAAVAVDAVGPVGPNPLRHGDHALFLDPTCRATFKAALSALVEGPPTARFQMAVRGHRFALEHHRAVSRVDDAMVALSQAWALWPTTESTPPSVF